jgi:PIN domain nuclease of toxin-antitoxin system
MKLLLDTHTFLWWDLTPEKLSEPVQKTFADESTILYLSYVSIWEIQIKQQLGKLKLRIGLKDLIQEQQETNGILLLPIHPDHIYTLAQLEDHHRDPFDRLLIAQALHENWSIVSMDKQLQKYPVTIFW